MATRIKKKRYKSMQLSINKPGMRYAIVYLLLMSPNINKIQKKKFHLKKKTKKLKIQNIRVQKNKLINMMNQMYRITKSRRL